MADLVARRVAARMAVDAEDALVTEVERRLAEAHRAGPVAYLEAGAVMDVANVVVGVSGLVWAVYVELRRRTARPEPQMVIREVRIEMSRRSVHRDDQIDRVTTLAVEEVFKLEGPSE